MRIVGFALPLLLAPFLFRDAGGSLVFSCSSDVHCLACHGIVRSCMSRGDVDVDQCVVDEERRAGLRSCLMHPFSSLSSDEVTVMLETDEEDFSDHAKYASMLQEIVEALKEKHSASLIQRDESEMSNESNESDASNESKESDGSTDPSGMNTIRELNGEAVTDESDIPEIMKKQLIKLCMYTNYHDKYENAKLHTQGTVADIEHNIVHVINNFIHEPDFKQRIENFLGNPAVCLKHPSDWVSDRALYEDPKVPSVGPIHIEETDLFVSNAGDPRSRSSTGGSCNMDRCNRFQDEQECEHKIRMLNQGTCSNCWAFAAATAFQAYRCRLGYGFTEPSIKYITLCKSEYFQRNHLVDACGEGGSILTFVNTLDKSKFLPTSFDLPYQEPFTDKRCPEMVSTKPNLWKEVTLNEKVLNRYRFRGYLRFDFSDYSKKGDIDSLIKIVKEAVIEQGAVFITMHVQTALPYDHNGEVVMVHCESLRADHAMTVVGYGSYTKPSGETGQYWLIRNSWGIKWGDKGYFKLDMYGPEGCKGDVLTSAFILNITIPKQSINAPLPNDKASQDLDTKHVINNPTSADSDVKPNDTPVRPFRGNGKKETTDPYPPHTVEPLKPVRPLRPVRPYNPGPVDPVQPNGPNYVDPVKPVRPLGPVRPFGPVRPLQPYKPERVEPVRPHRPYRTITPDKSDPVRPYKPYTPERSDPVRPVRPYKPYTPNGGKRVTPASPYFPNSVHPDCPPVVKCVCP